MAYVLFQIACLLLCFSEEPKEIQTVLVNQKQTLTDLQNKEKEIDKKLINLKETPKEDIKQFVEKYPARLKAKSDLEKYEIEYKKNKEDAILGEEAFQKVIKGRSALTFADRDAKAKYEDSEKENLSKFTQEKSRLENLKKQTVEDITRTIKGIEESELKLKLLIPEKTNEIVKTEPPKIIQNQSPSPIKQFNRPVENETNKTISCWQSSSIVLILAVVAIGWLFVKSKKSRGNQIPITTYKSSNNQKFIKPDFIINGPGLFNVNAVGESNYQKELLNIHGPKKARGTNLIIDAVLVLENTNRYDKNAVLISINGLKIGYLSKENAIEYRKILISLNQANSNAGCKAQIVGGWDDGKGDEGFFGVKLDLPN
jgi:hypothetical protein